MRLLSNATSPAGVFTFKAHDVVNRVPQVANGVTGVYGDVWFCSVTSAV